MTLIIEQADKFPFEDYKSFILNELTPSREHNKYFCPICGSGTGKHRTPAFSINQDYTGHCYSCGFHGDIFDLYMKRDNIDGDEARRRVVERYGDSSGRARTAGAIHPDRRPKSDAEQDFLPYIEECAKAYAGSPAESYMRGRGFTDEFAEAFRFGYDKSKDAVVIPYPDENYYITRSIKDKAYRKPTGSTEPIFNRAILDEEADRVFITEGQIDALSLIQAGASACAIGGGGDRKLDGVKIKCRRVYIFADADEAGEATAERIKERLSGSGIITEIVYPQEEGCKDVNDMLVKYPDKLLEHLRSLVDHEQKESTQRREAYMARAAAGVAVNIWGMDSAQTFSVSTGFRGLDASLGGGIYEGLYCIGAVSSLGKTTFALQVAEQIAQGGTDVLFFSLEMKQEELVAKSLSRLSYQLSDGNVSNAKTSRGITDPQRRARYNSQEWGLLADASSAYYQYGRRIWIDEGIGDIGTDKINNRIAEHIRVTGRKPVVFIDYLQILQSPDVRMSDKQATDKNVFSLKRISREYKIPVIVISSLNRDNYSQEINMAAFKESGAIEYSSDVLIGLQPQGMDGGTTDSEKKSNRQVLKNCKAGDIRRIELVVLKNRHGKANDKVTYEYIPAFNCFTEQ